MKIEKGIPAPNKRGKPFSEETTTLKEMEVGDSFFKEDYTADQAANLRSSSLRVPGEFIVRKMASGGYRCWRVK